MLRGGMDSFNLLVPHTCQSDDLYAEYAAIRGNNLQVPRDDLLQVVVDGTQWLTQRFQRRTTLQCVWHQYSLSNSQGVV